MDPKGRVAIITGGASGLGKATAEQLLGQGAKVFIVDQQGEAAQALADSHGENAGCAQCDVTDAGQVESAVNQALDQFGQIDILINCAGVGIAARTIGREAPHNLDHFKKIIDINLIGTFDMIRHVAFQMARQDPGEDGSRGVIVNTASVAAFDGQIGQAGYAASKAGIVGMTLPIARDLSSLGIRVCTICPGIFDTPLMAGAPDEVIQNLAATVPFPKRLGQPAEFAALAEHIIRNNYLNGETIRLDGSIRMAPK